MEVAKPISLAKQRRARAAWVFELGPVTLVFATIILVSMTSLLYLTQASRVAATGYDISAAEEQRSALERQHQLLLVQEAELQALQRVEYEATTELKMVPAPPPEHVRVGDPPVDVDGAVEHALIEAQHLPMSWRERLAAALRPGRAGR
ncbi:MAG: cell division protein FtsL [Chloroflexota bacterium]